MRLYRNTNHCDTRSIIYTTKKTRPTQRVLVQEKHIERTALRAPHKKQTLMNQVKCFTIIPLRFTRRCLLSIESTPTKSSHNPTYPMESHSPKRTDIKGMVDHIDTLRTHYSSPPPPHRCLSQHFPPLDPPALTLRFQTLLLPNVSICLPHPTPRNPPTGFGSKCPNSATTSLPQ